MRTYNDYGVTGASNKKEIKIADIKFYCLLSSHFKRLLVDKLNMVNIGFKLHQVLCGMRWSKNKYFHFKFIPPHSLHYSLARWTEYTHPSLTRCPVKQAKPSQSHRLSFWLVLFLKAGRLLRIQKVEYKVGAEDLESEG